MDIAAQIIDQTGADWVTAMSMAEETISGVFDQAV